MRQFFLRFQLVPRSEHVLVGGHAAASDGGANKDIQLVVLRDTQLQVPRVDAPPARLLLLLVSGLGGCWTCVELLFLVLHAPCIIRRYY